MKYLAILLFVMSPMLQTAQELSGAELLDKAIAYHDPKGNWETFSGTFNVTMETPSGPNRDSTIKINLPEEYFYVKAARDTITTEYAVTKADCKIMLNGDDQLSAAILKENNLSCERAGMYQNYYTYLYGLPMKLKDPGTNVDSSVETKTFKGKEYLVLKASYDAEVGSDVWYFYFDPTTYAMEIYQFYKGDPLKEGKDTGEYILLTEEMTVNGVKMPKNRAWYYNKDDKYLGTDKLK
jgi:hypothetical protein